MGVDSYSFVSALSGIVAQRLVRLNCRQCLKPYNPPYALLARSQVSVKSLRDTGFRHGVGCSVCRGTGFKGRKAIAERLPMTDNLRDLLAERAPLSRIKAAAREKDYHSLREAAVAAVLAGETTLEEVNRVTTVD
jgi:general secretion pathway protein E